MMFMIAVDSFFVFVFTYLMATVEECPWDFTIFQKLIIAVVAVIIYNGLLRVKVLGGVIMLAMSAAFTWLVLQLVPLMKWVNGSKVWYWSIAVVLYVLVAMFHGPLLAESFSGVELAWVKVKKRLGKKAGSYGQSQAGGYGDGYGDNGQARGYGSADTSSQAEVTRFFTGCKTEEEVKKRLRALTKTFHPDNSEGDEETYKKILAEYEHMKGKFGA